MTTSQKNMIAVAAVTVTVRLTWHYLTDFVADDAFITFRYAENIAHGLGFVYNVNQPVLGTTTPFFTLILALFNFFTIPTPTAALFVSLVCSAFTAVIIYRFALLLRFTHLAWLPVVLYAFWPRALPAETCGMETALFTLLITAVFYYAYKRQPFYALGVATLSAVTRPEGLGLTVLLLLYYAFTERHQLKNLILIPAMILVPWALFSFFYFGSVIPNSITAKLALYSQSGSNAPIDNIVYLLGLHRPIGWATNVAFVIGAFWLNRKQNYGWLAILWIICFFAFFTFSRTHLFFWYVSPIYPMMLLFVGAAVVQIFEWIRLDTIRFKIAAMIIILITSLGLIAGNYSGLVYYSNFQKAQEDMHRSVGLYLRAHADENQLVAAEDIGYIGYYSDRRILDRDGLISPESALYNRAGDYLELLIDYQPDWLVVANPSPFTNFLHKSKFLDRFEERKVFSSTTTEISYIIYRAKEKRRLDKDDQF